MNNFLNLTGINLDYPLPTIIFNIIFALLLGIILALVYKKNHKGLSYSDSFTFTLVLLAGAGSVLMMIVGNSLARAFSLFGAFSIIRFRTAVKDTKDIAYVFISLILGMSVGTNNYSIAVVSIISLSLAITLMTKRRFGTIGASNNLLTFYMADNQSHDKLQPLFLKYLKSHQLANLVSFKDQKQTELSYQVSLKPQTSSDKFIKALKELKGVDRIRLVSLEDSSSQN